MAGFFFTGEENLTPSAIDRKRQLINALAKENLSTAPVGHWTQALARVLGAGADVYQENRLNAAEKKGMDENKAALMAAFGIGGGGVSPSIAPIAAAGVPPSTSAPAAAPSPNVSQETMPAPVDGTPLPPIRPQSLGGQATGIPSPFGGLQQSGALAFAPPAAAVPAPGPDGVPPNLELAARTIAAETSGDPRETQAIAAVIVNRLKSGKWGNSLGDVVLAKNQFEPWNGGPGARNDPMAIDPNSPRLKMAQQALAAALAGQDPTNGATHFFAPGAQAALGRQAPSWAQGGGQRIGATAFYAPEGRVQGGAINPALGSGQPVYVPPGAPPGTPPAQINPMPPQMAEAPAPGASPAQFNVPGQGGANPRTAALLQALSSPWAAKNPLLAGVASKVLGEQLTGNKLTYQTDGSGNIIALDPSGRRPPQVVYKADVKPLTLAEGAKLVDPNTGRVIADGGNKGTNDFKNYEAAKQQGFTGSFYDYQVAMKRAGSAQPENTFNVEMAKGNAKVFQELAGDLPSAKSDAGQIKLLREQLGKTPGGFLGGVQAYANRLGIKIGPNASAIEATNAILNKLTPAQRQGMPGAASDRDVAMFRDALPKLNNTPEGNKIILDTMDALAQSRIKQAQIANDVRVGRKTPEQAFKELEALPDPFAAFKGAGGGVAAPAMSAAPATGSGWREIAPGVRIREVP